MKIELNSVIVQDQETALRFYTEVLGFTKKVDLPLSEYRWLHLRQLEPDLPGDLSPRAAAHST